MRSLFFVSFVSFASFAYPAFTWRYKLKSQKHPIPLGEETAVETSLHQRFSVLCFGLMLSLPFLLPVHDQPIPSFYSEVLAILLGLLGALFLFFSPSVSRELSIPQVLNLPLILLLPVCLQWGLGYFAYASSAILLISYLCWLALVMVAVHSLTVTLGEDVLLPRVAYFVLIGSCLNALIGLFQFFDLAAAFSPWMIEHVKGAGVYGNLAQENHFATHLAIGLSALIYLRAMRKMQWFLTVPLACLLVGGIFLSGSRSGLIFLEIGRAHV